MSWHFKQLTASICCHKVISCSQLSHLSVFMFYHVSILSADPSSQLHHPSFHSLRSPPNFHWYPFSSNCLHSLFVRTRRHAGTCFISPSTLIPPHTSPLPTLLSPLPPSHHPWAPVSVHPTEWETKPNEPKNDGWSRWDEGWEGGGWARERNGRGGREHRWGRGGGRGKVKQKKKGKIC